MRNFQSYPKFNNRVSDRGSYNSFRERPQMFKVICDECQRNCEVPFKPNGSKKIFCSECFEKQNKGSSENRYDNRFNRRDSENRYNNRFDRRDREKIEHIAICSECGNSCTLPFIPSSDKPVYCSDCFSRRGERNNTGNSNKVRNAYNEGEINKLKEQLEELNTKMDNIINALDIKIKEPITITVSKEEMIKALDKPTPKLKEKVTKKVKKEKLVTKKSNIKILSIS